jgi:hypothetical protein
MTFFVELYSSEAKDNKLLVLNATQKVIDKSEETLISEDASTTFKTVNLNRFVQLLYSIRFTSEQVFNFFSDFRRMKSKKNQLR